MRTNQNDARPHAATTTPLLSMPWSGLEVFEPAARTGGQEARGALRRVVAVRHVVHLEERRAPPSQGGVFRSEKGVLASEARFF